MTTYTDVMTIARDGTARASGRCDCGMWLERCRDCEALRCPHCEPYVSEDCFA